MKRKENMFLNKDQTKVLDLDGNVKYVATTDENGIEYFTKPENLVRGKVCVGWEESEICVGWNEYKVCISWTKKKFCVEWSDD